MSREFITQCHDTTIYRVDLLPERGHFLRPTGVAF
jgi:hypothetical protein